MKQNLKKFLGLILVVLVLYGMLLKFPQVLFSYKISYKDFNIYSTEKMDKSMYALIDSIDFNIARSEFYNESQVHNIFICNGQFLYGTLSYPSRTTFAGNNLILGNILVAKADIESNLSYRSMDNRTRELTNLLTHEITHSLLYNHLGLRAYFSLPTWKNEGYCDAIAKSSTLNEREEIEIICAGKNLKSYSYYRLGIEHLIKERNLSMKEIIDQNFSYDELMTKVKLKYCSEH